MNQKNHNTHETRSELPIADLQGIIHDVKNLMCAIINTTELLTIGVPAEHPCCKKLQLIVQLTEQCMQLLSSSQAIRSEYIDNVSSFALLPLLNDIVSMIEFRKDNNLHVELSCSGLNPIIVGNKIDLQNAIHNICINAIEAMPDNGTLLICVSYSEKQEKPDFCDLASVNKKYIKIVISDNGSGISPERLPFIFDQFYSTKHSSGISQRGMGLFRAKECINTFGGTIEVQSVLAQGTTFTILLPIIESYKK